MDVGPMELLIVLAVVLVLFGGKKLPELAKSLGRAKKEFEDGLDEGGTQHHANVVNASATESVPTTPVPSPTPAAATESAVNSGAGSEPEGDPSDEPTGTAPSA